MGQRVAPLGRAQLFFRWAAFAKIIFGQFKISRLHRRKSIVVTSCGALHSRNTAFRRARLIPTIQVEDLGDRKGSGHYPDDGGEGR
jgi:hypothetical protein